MVDPHLDEFSPAAFLPPPSAAEELAAAIVHRPEVVREVMASLNGAITVPEQRAAGGQALAELAQAARQKAVAGMHVEPDEIRAVLVQEGLSDLEKPLNRPMGMKVLLEVWKEDRRGLRGRFKDARRVAPEGAPPV